MEPTASQIIEELKDDAFTMFWDDVEKQKLLSNGHETDIHDKDPSLKKRDRMDTKKLETNLSAEEMSLVHNLIF